MSQTESKFYKRFLLNLFFIFSFISIIEFSSATISKIMFGRRYRSEHFLARILAGNFGIQKSEDISSKLFKHLVDLRISGNKVYPVYSYDPQMHAPLEKYWISRPKNTKILNRSSGSATRIRGK